MELLFLCTILMALVSYFSMALAKPIENTPIESLTVAQSEANIIELLQDANERELIRLATA